MTTSNVTRLHPHARAASFVPDLRSLALAEPTRNTDGDAARWVRLAGNGRKRTTLRAA